MGAGATFAQGIANQPALAANPSPAKDGIAKVQQKQRDSGAPRPSENSSGVRTRRKPDAAATTPDTSYHTITNAPPNSAPNPGASAPAVTFAPNTPSRSRTVGGAQRGPAAGGSGKTTLPESMQIQQETVRALPPRRDLITKGGTSGAPAAPSVVNSSVERNRLDSAAPSRQRLQIDDLSEVRAQQQTPNAAAASPSNPVANGLPSSNGNGTSGSGVAAAPFRSVAVGRSPMSSSARSAAAPAAALHASAGSGSSGGGH